MLKKFLHKNFNFLYFSLVCFSTDKKNSTGVFVFVPRESQEKVVFNFDSVKSRPSKKSRFEKFLPVSAGAGASRVGDKQPENSMLLQKNDQVRAGNSRRARHYNKSKHFRPRRPRYQDPRLLKFFGPKLYEEIRQVVPRTFQTLILKYNRPRMVNKLIKNTVVNPKRGLVFPKNLKPLVVKHKKRVVAVIAGRPVVKFKDTSIFTPKLKLKLNSNAKLKLKPKLKSNGKLKPKPNANLKLKPKLKSKVKPKVKELQFKLKPKDKPKVRNRRSRNSSRRSHGQHKQQRNKRFGVVVSTPFLHKSKFYRQNRSRRLAAKGSLKRYFIFFTQTQHYAVLVKNKVTRFYAWLAKFMNWVVRYLNYRKYSRTRPLREKATKDFLRGVDQSFSRKSRRQISKKADFYYYFVLFNRFLKIAKNSTLKKFYLRFRFLKLNMLKAFSSFRRFFTFSKLIKQQTVHDTKRLFLENIVRIQNNILLLSTQLNSKAQGSRSSEALMLKLFRNYSLLFSIWRDADTFSVLDKDLPLQRKRRLLKFYMTPGQLKYTYHDQKFVFKVISFNRFIKQHKTGFSLRSLKFSDNLFFWYAFTRKKLQQNLWLVRGKKFLKQFFSFKLRYFFSRLKFAGVIIKPVKSLFISNGGSVLNSVFNYFAMPNTVVSSFNVDFFFTDFFFKTKKTNIWMLLLRNVLKFFGLTRGVKNCFDFLFLNCLSQFTVGFMGLQKTLFNLLFKFSGGLSFIFSQQHVQNNFQFFLVFIFNNVFMHKIIKFYTHQTLFFEFASLKKQEYGVRDISFFGYKKKCLKTK